MAMAALSLGSTACATPTDSRANIQETRCSILFTAEPMTVAAPPGLSQPSRFGTQKADFQHDTHYSLDLVNQSDVRDQCQLGVCSLHSWVSMLEQGRLNSKREPIQLSTHYLSAQHWLARSLALLDYNDQSAESRAKFALTPVAVKLGANIFTSRLAISKYGLIPEEAWTAQRDFQEGQVTKKVSEYIQNIIARAKWDVAHQPDARTRNETIEKARQQIRSIFENVIGEIPKEFMYKDRKYTPRTFAMQFFPELERPIVQMSLNRQETDKTTVDDRMYWVHVDTNIDSIEKTARALLDKGMNVELTIEINASYIDVKTGIMSLAAFHYPLEGGPLNREQRDLYGLTTTGHSVQLVGYDADPVTGKIIKWKIKNSWGTKSGDSGYYHVYDDYFRMFAMGISFFRDAGVPLPQGNSSIEPRQLGLKFK
jgi:bleomycin hydrolase